MTSAPLHHGFRTSPAPSETLPGYVLITPARNEAQYIERTIASVLAQTVLPLKWVIVSDGSTDGTDEIVRRHLCTHDWIELVRMPERRDRDFAGKVTAFNAGLARMDGVSYEILASLDADIAFESGYFEFLLRKLAAHPRLGVAGTPYRETARETYNYRFVSPHHVSGACQVFRRACFEEMGGYVAVPGGAIDTIATLAARMKGWETRTFTEMSCLHLRTIGGAERGQVRSRFDLGMRDYAVGNHPLWQLCRSLYQGFKRPYLLRGLVLMAGYLYAAVRRQDRPVSQELVAFRRKEQMERLRVFALRPRTSPVRSGDAPGRRCKKLTRRGE